MRVACALHLVLLVSCLTGCNVADYDPCRGPAVVVPLDFSQFREFEFRIGQLWSPSTLPDNVVASARMTQQGDTITAALDILHLGLPGCFEPDSQFDACLVMLPPRVLSADEANAVRRAFASVLVRVRLDTPVIVARGLLPETPDPAYRIDAFWDGTSLSGYGYPEDAGATEGCVDPFDLRPVVEVLEALRTGWGR